MARTPTAQLSPADRVRRAALRRMKAICLAALIALAILFVFAFVFEQRAGWLSYVRAATEGGMVGALADWFAVTALFRHPLGLPIPHTAIIPERKDEIGRTLGEFVETNFLSAAVVRTRLSAVPVAARTGRWLAGGAGSRRVAAEGSAMAAGILRTLSDADVQKVLESLARDHLIEPEWSSAAGRWLQRVVDASAHAGAVDLAVDSLAGWLSANQRAFDGLVSRRLPGWVPSIAHRFVDETVYHEAIRFVEAVRADPHHPARTALDGYLDRLAGRLQHDPAMIARFEQAKADLFDSPRLRALAARTWSAAKAGLLQALEDPDSALRRRTEEALIDVGVRLQHDTALQRRVDEAVTDGAVYLVDRYRHDIASVITDTVERWEADETTEKIELMVGRDLQYIRLNGTVIGALAGLLIYTVANLALG